MTRIKVALLSGRNLDWAVATCEGLNIEADPMGFGVHHDNGGYWVWSDEYGSNKMRIGKEYSPSTKWNQAGLILEKYGIFPAINKGALHVGQAFKAETKNGVQYAKTPLEAVMKAVVELNLGKEIEVPKILL
ncbi:hypothetical protein A3715_14025 [Oleiphilus sp. HI0009]|nr:hypothetical protein A3715_14025 [Oleiphilus sp. HI0009]